MYIYRIAGLVLAWSSMEHRLLIERGPDSVSPQLVHTSIWCTIRIMSAFGWMMENYTYLQPLAVVAEDFHELSRIVVDFAVQKAFAVMNQLSGERKFAFLEFFQFSYGTVKEPARNLQHDNLLTPRHRKILSDFYPHYLLFRVINNGILIFGWRIFNRMTLSG